MLIVHRLDLEARDKAGISANRAVVACAAAAIVIFGATTAVAGLSYPVALAMQARDT